MIENNLIVNKASIFHLINEQIKQKIKTEDIHLQGFFWLNKNKDQKIYLISTQNYIIIAEKLPNGFIYHNYLQISFEIKYEVLFEDGNTASSNQNSINLHPVGFKLLSHKLPAIEFQLIQPSLVKFWLRFLSKNLNQLGFHQFYRPTRKLGKGGFATVYEVERVTDKKRFAVKAFSKQNTINSEKEQNRQNLLNQIKLMRIIENPHVIKLQGVFESDNSLYVVLELITAGQLHTRINKRLGKFQLQQVKEFLFGLCKGLSELHDNRIMHRDLKPQNIMLRSEDKLEPVIADFGLAAHVDSSDYIFYRCGTPGYVAPEITTLVKGQKIEPVCDIFSAGAIFHILLTGKPLFPGRTFEEAYDNNRKMKFDLTTAHYQHFDHSAMNLLKKMLDLNPHTRIKAREVLGHPFLEGVMQYEKEEIGHEIMTNLNLGSFKKAQDL